MSRIAIAWLTAFFSLAAAQDEMIENPEYKGWASQKVGAWVKQKLSNDMGTMKVEGDMTTTLKELTPEKAVLEVKTVVDVMGQKNESSMTRTAPVKIRKGTDGHGGKVETIAEGDEELTIKDKKYKCHWIQMKITSKQGTMMAKNWRSDQIPGGSVKLEINSEGPPKTTMTLNVTEWKAGE